MPHFWFLITVRVVVFAFDEGYSGLKILGLPSYKVISCVPEDACGDNSDVLWSWAFHHTDGRFQADSVYPYNRTCNFFREYCSG